MAVNKWLSLPHWGDSLTLRYINEKTFQFTQYRNIKYKLRIPIFFFGFFLVYFYLKRPKCAQRRENAWCKALCILCEHFHFSIYVTFNLMYYFSFFLHYFIAFYSICVCDSVPICSCKTKTVTEKLAEIIFLINNRTGNGLPLYWKVLTDMFLQLLADVSVIFYCRFVHGRTKNYVFLHIAFNSLFQPPTVLIRDSSFCNSFSFRKKNWNCLCFNPSSWPIACS